MSDFAELLRVFTADMVVSARLWRKLAREAVARYGVAEAGAAPLLWIGRLGGKVRQNVLAEYCGMEGASLVRILDELQAAGLVVRVPDATDRRGHPPRPAGGGGGKAKGDGGGTGGLWA